MTFLLGPDTFDDAVGEAVEDAGKALDGAHQVHVALTGLGVTPLGGLDCSALALREGIIVGDRGEDVSAAGAIRCVQQRISPGVGRGHTVDQGRPVLGLPDGSKEKSESCEGVHHLLNLPRLTRLGRRRRLRRFRGPPRWFSPRRRCPLGR